MNGFRRILRGFLLVLAVLLIGGQAFAASYYVQAKKGNDANQGDDWGAKHALKTIGRAIELAQASAGPDDIHVAAGTYTEHVLPVSDIALWGGYPASGGSWYKRNRDKHKTIIDGSNNGPAIFIDTRQNVVLDGFLLRNGHEGYIGGGVRIADSSSVTINNNDIQKCSADLWGGGIGVNGGQNITLSNNLISKNTAEQRGGALSLYHCDPCVVEKNAIKKNKARESGAGVALVESSVVVRENTIDHNKPLGGDFESGGGLDVVCVPSSTIDILDNVIEKNVGGNGAGMALYSCVGATISRNTISQNESNYDGGGIYFSGSSGEMERNIIQGNSARNWGGGVCIYGSQVDTAVNNLITNNTARENGGGISLYNASTATIMNNTIARNKADLGSGLYIDGGNTATVTNSILWFNAGDQIENGGTLTITYSDVEDGGTGNGNINTNPKFVSASNFYLKKTSPCIDTGTNVGAPPNDLDGNARPYGPGFDMGAYEWRPGAAD
jgi:parallel beta-helix repeat protein